MSDAWTHRSGVGPGLKHPALYEGNIGGRGSDSGTAGGASGNPSDSGSPVDGSPNTGNAPPQVGGAPGRDTGGGGGGGGGGSSEPRTRTISERVSGLGGGIADRVDAIADTAGGALSSTISSVTGGARDVTTDTVEDTIGAISNIGDDSGSSSPSPTNDFTGQSTVSTGLDNPLQDARQPTDPVERTEAGLNDISETIRPTLRGFGDAVGQGVATASLAPAIEEAAFGTDRSEAAIRGATQEAALALDLPGAASAGVSGADFVFRGPDNTDLTRGEAARRAVSQGIDQFTTAAQENPAETTGRAVGAIAGGFGVGTAAARGGRRLARGLGSADDAAGATQTPTTPDTGGLGSRGTGNLLDADAVDAARGVEEPGYVQRTLGDIRRNNPADNIRTRTDTAESAQLGVTRQQPRSRSPDLADDRVTPNLYQQSIDNQLRRQRRATDDSTFDGGGSPFDSDDLRAQREADAEAIARRERENPGALFDETDDVTGFGSVEGFGPGVGGLGGLLGSSTLSGQETPETAQTLFEGTGDDIFSGDDTGLDTETDAGTDTGLDTGLGGGTATDTDTTAAQTFTLRETAQTGSQPGQRPANAPPTPTTETATDPTLGQPTLGGGGRGPTTRTGRTPTPRLDPGFGEEDDDEEFRFGLSADDREFSSGILSGAEALDDVGGFDRGPANTPEQVDGALDDVFPGLPDTASRNDRFSL